MVIKIVIDAVVIKANDITFSEYKLANTDVDAAKRTT